MENARNELIALIQQMSDEQVIELLNLIVLNPTYSTSDQ